MPMADVKFIDHTEQVQSLLAELAESVLEECAGELESQVKRNTKVDTGQTKNSWTHRVVGSMMAGEYKAEIGSPLENAIWEEFGTGEYALNGDGRKGGWFYKDEKGDGHFTHGKHPRRPFHKAYTSLKHKLIKRIQDRFKGGLS
jgi:hypothetical protein